MKLREGTYKNFCNYDEITLDFSDLGLTLISGPTGSGKSTVMDMPAWCLFGTTSKDGAADDVIPWWHPETPTLGIQTVELPGGPITVTRIRKTGQNDLFWIEGDDTENKKRGKDLNETQRLLEKRLGISSDLYFSAAYFHQFSRADSFFVAKAKERRELFDRIADTGLAVRLGAGASDARKATKAQFDLARTAAAHLSGKAAAQEQGLAGLEARSKSWARTRADGVAASRIRSNAFTRDRERRLGDILDRIQQLGSEACSGGRPELLSEAQERLRGLEGLRPSQVKAQKDLAQAEAALSSLLRDQKRFLLPGVAVCPTCLGPTDNANRAAHLAELTTKIAVAEKAAKKAAAVVAKIDKQLAEIPTIQKQIRAMEAEVLRVAEVARQTDALIAEHERVLAEADPHAAEIARLEASANPHEDQIEETAAQLKATQDELCAAKEKEASLSKRVSDLTVLYDLAADLRGKLLEKAIHDAEEETNAALTKYFDGELRVTFALDGDSLDIEIAKNGYLCGFKQLSGGQRCQLKLAFGAAVMRAAANKAGVHFDCLFFDEPLAGLDTELKVKAFRLFEDLEAQGHPSVFVIEHCEEFKTMFAHCYSVKVSGDISSLVEAPGE